MADSDETKPQLVETGYFYPEPFWMGDDGTWVKSLLLFFDKIAILLPKYMYGRHDAADPSVAGALEDQGLLEILQPEEFIDQQMTQTLIALVHDLLGQGAFDDLPDSDYFAELSWSRLGWNADVRLSSDLVEELQARGLARPSEDGVSVPLHPQVRSTILVLISQLARASGRRYGLDLHPITPDPDRVGDLIATLKLGSSRPSPGDVVTLDLETVGFNLEGVPLDDVLDFKGEHGEQFRKYARSVRKSVAELSAADPLDRPMLLADRRDELAEQAEQLRKASRKRWRTPLGRLGLGAAGVGVNLAATNVPGAIIAGLAGLLGAKPDAMPDSVYSYLFAAERRMGG